MAYFAICTTTMYGAKETIDGSRCNNGQSLLKNHLVRIGACSESHGATLLPPGYIPPINQYIKGIARSTSTAINTTIPNQTSNYKFSILTRRRIEF